MSNIFVHYISRHHLRKMLSCLGNRGRSPYVTPRGSSGEKNSFHPVIQDKFNPYYILNLISVTELFHTLRKKNPTEGVVGTFQSLFSLFLLGVRRRRRKWKQLLLFTCTNGRKRARVPLN